MIKQVIKSLKVNKESAILLHQGEFKLLKDGSDYSHPEMTIPSLMFDFLCSIGYIDKINTYAGVKAVRIFDRCSKLPHLPLETIEQDYDKYKSASRKSLRKELKALKNISHENLTSSMKTTNANLANFNAKVYIKGCLVLQINNSTYQLGTHFSKKNMVNGIFSNIEKLENKLITCNHYVSASEFNRAKIPFLEDNIKSIRTLS